MSAYSFIIETLRTKRKLNSDSVAVFVDFSESLKSATAPILDFITDYPNISEFRFYHNPLEPLFEDRIRACNIFFHWLHLDENNPRYSSFLLENSLRAIRKVPGSRGREVILALSEFIEYYELKLLAPTREKDLPPWQMAMFIRNICRSMCMIFENVPNDFDLLYDFCIEKLRVSREQSYLAYMTYYWLYSPFHEDCDAETDARILEYENRYITETLDWDPNLFFIVD